MGCCGNPPNRKRLKVTEGRSVPVSREDWLWRFLPGTSAELAARTGIGRRTVQRILRKWREQGQVTMATRWYGSLRYTWVYERKADYGGQHAEV